MVLLLEDDAARVAGFRRAIARAVPGMAVQVWDDARVMVREVGPLLSRAHLISLDHDLAAPPGTDPGDGLEVARALAAQPVVRPVIVHSSNSERARMMVGEFELAGWPCVRVLPIGEGWIDEDWAVEAARMLSARP